MKVFIKDWKMDLEVKNKGIEFDICNTQGEHLGDMILSKTGLTWCKGKAQNGKQKKWEEIIKIFNED